MQAWSDEMKISARWTHRALISGLVRTRYHYERALKLHPADTANGTPRVDRVWYKFGDGPVLPPKRRSFAYRLDQSFRLRDDDRPRLLVILSPIILIIIITARDATFAVIFQLTASTNISHRRFRVFVKMTSGRVQRNFIRGVRNKLRAFRSVELFDLGGRFWSHESVRSFSRV